MSLPSKLFICLPLLMLLACSPSQLPPACLQPALTLGSDSDRQSWVNSFVDSMAAIHQIPFIQGDSIHFFYRHKGESAFLAGDMNQWEPEEHEMYQLEGTDLWYHSLKTVSNARLEYKFVNSEGKWEADPINELQTEGYYVNSILEMPDYVRSTDHLLQPDIPHGKVDTLLIDTADWDMVKQVFVYTPPGYDSTQQSYATVYLHDGEAQVRQAQVPNIIDNLLAKKKIEPLIAVFVEPKNRNTAYAFDDKKRFASFFAKELTAYMDTHYRTKSSPENRLTIGASFGGLISVNIAYTYPEIFGNCGVHSAAFWPEKRWGLKLLKDHIEAPVRYAAIWGSYDGVRYNNQEALAAFEKIGQEVYWKVYPEGHTWSLWTATTDEFLIHFFPAGN